MGKRSLLAVAVLLLVGCGPARVIQESQKDSIVTVIRDTTIYRDSIIYIKVEAEKDSVVIPDTDTSRLSTRYAESEAYVSNGLLHHSLRNRSEALIPIETKMPIVIHTESASLVRERKVIETVEVEKSLSRWQQFIMALGYAVLGAVAAWLAMKVAKFII